MNKTALLSLFVFLIILLVSCDKKVAKVATPPPTPVAGFCDSIKFTKHIKPIILANCALPGCHGAGSGNGDFTGYNGLKIKVDNTSFKTRVFDSPNNPMPPSGMLAQTKLDSIKCWLDKGAPNN